MAAMKFLLVCLAVGLSFSQVSAITVTNEWRLPITLTNTVSVGDTVIWNWADNAPHDVAFLTYPNGFTGLPTNGMNGLVVPPAPVRAPYTVSFTPTIPGTYTYDCSVHPTMVGTLTVLAAGPGNATLGPANVTTVTSPAQAAVTNRTLGFATAAVTRNVTGALSYLAPDFTAFAYNVSGPLTLQNATLILGYINQNLIAASAANPLANVTAPVVKQFILIDPTNALITAQIPVLQHFATIYWTYTNSTPANTTSDWYAKTAVFTPAPISLV